MHLDFHSPKTLSGGRIGIAAQALDSLQELVPKYSKERKAFEKNI